jgi:hypothetical protein
MTVLREEYFRRLVDAAHVELFLSGNDGARMYWPWRMQPPKESAPSYRNACEVYAIDSDPLDDDVTTADVLHEAVRLDAEIASLQDVYHDMDATADSLLEGLGIADSHAFDGSLMLPLQEPYIDCWKEIGEPTKHIIGLGGLKDGSAAARIQAAEEFSSAAGTDIHLHGFGWGPRGDLGAWIRNHPDVLDSLDYSTPIQTGINQELTPGDERMSVQAAYAAFRLIRDLREVSSCPDPVEETTLQIGLGES